MNSFRLPQLGDEQLGRILARLPIGVIVVNRNRDVIWVNSVAQRLCSPSRLRRGLALPEPWPHFSLRAYADRLFSPGVAPDQQISPDQGRLFVVSGITARDEDIVTILLEDVSAPERRRRAEREFIANAAHELLTPLTGIVSAAHVLEAGAKDVPEERERFIGHISRECERLARIARALLVLARAQSGEQAPRPEAWPLCDLLDELGTAAEAEGVDLDVHCSDDLRVFVDRDLFELALGNLVANSARHAAGKIAISAASREPSHVQIEVASDTRWGGPGPAQLRRMEDRFYTSGGLDSGGFGLGISIARQSIEACGGTFRLAAREGEGLNASIEVPAVVEFTE